MAQMQGMQQMQLATLQALTGGGSQASSSRSLPLLLQEPCHALTGGGSQASWSRPALAITGPQPSDRQSLSDLQSLQEMLPAIALPAADASHFDHAVGAARAGTQSLQAPLDVAVVAPSIQAPSDATVEAPAAAAAADVATARKRCRPSLEQSISLIASTIGEREVRKREVKNIW